MKSVASAPQEPCETNAHKPAQFQNAKDCRNFPARSCVHDGLVRQATITFATMRKLRRHLYQMSYERRKVFDALPKTSGPSGLTDRFSIATAPANWFQELCLTSTRWLNTWLARRRCLNSRKHGRAPGIATRRAEGWKSGLEHGHPETGPPVAARPSRSSSAPAEVALQLHWLASHWPPAASQHGAGSPS